MNLILDQLPWLIPLHQRYKELKNHVHLPLTHKMTGHPFQKIQDAILQMQELLRITTKQKDTS